MASQKNRPVVTVTGSHQRTCVFGTLSRGIEDNYFVSMIVNSYVNNMLDHLVN